MRKKKGREEAKKDGERKIRMRTKRERTYLGLHELGTGRELDDNGDEIVKRSNEGVLPRLGEIDGECGVL